MATFRYYRLGEGVRRRVIERLREILIAEGVELAIVFGSFVDLESFRDIDVAVYLGDPEDIDRILKLGVKLEDAVGIPVDVVPLQQLPPRSRLKILTKGMVVVEKPGVYEALWSQTIDELAIMSSSEEQPNKHG